MLLTDILLLHIELTVILIWLVITLIIRVFFNISNTIRYIENPERERNKVGYETFYSKCPYAYVSSITKYNM